jgi:N-acetylglucosaminyldiphosphoundecaprenol N-acetyl-beta-D-mannosaminyltransferase
MDVTDPKTPKAPLFGVGMSAVDYRQAADSIISAAKSHRSFGATALATHGLMEAVADQHLREQINSLDLVTPDGQPVRWAMNALSNTSLPDRVSGPDLVRHVCEMAESEEVGIYLYGSSNEVCRAFAARLQAMYPDLLIVGVQPDRFRDATPAEDRDDIQRIHASGAGIVFVGRGCPRQERWVADHLGRVDAAMVAVGAAFDFYAGTLSRAPAWMQRAGLEWLMRLVQEPRRLWRRYFFTNSRFIATFVHHYIAHLTTPRAR